MVDGHCLATCHRCPHRQKACAGACLCTLDGRDIIDHATAGDCPAGRYGQPAERCAHCGGPHLTTACPLPADYDPRDWRQDSRGNDGCGCKG